MAIKKKGGDEFAAQEPAEAVDSAKVAKGARSSASPQRKPLTIAAIVGGGVIALGAAFGIGLAAGHAAPGFPGGPELASGAMHVDGHGDRDGARDGDHRGGPKGHHGSEHQGQGMPGHGKGQGLPGHGQQHDNGATDGVTPAPSTTP